MMGDHNEEPERQDWMKGVSSTVNHEDYLLGRKIDKTFELAKKEQEEEAREARIEALSKDKLNLKADPILELERRKERIKYEILTNPIKLKQFRDFLKKHEEQHGNPSDKSPPEHDKETKQRDSHSSSRSERSSHRHSPRQDTSHHSRSNHHSHQSKSRSDKDRSRSDSRRSHGQSLDVYQHDDRARHRSRDDHHRYDIADMDRRDDHGSHRKFPERKDHSKETRNERDRESRTHSRHHRSEIRSTGRHRTKDR